MADSNYLGPPLTFLEAADFNKLPGLLPSGGVFGSLGACHDILVAAFAFYRKWFLFAHEKLHCSSIYCA